MTITKDLLIRILEEFDDDAEILISTKKEAVSVVKCVVWSKTHNGLVLSNHNYGHEEARREDIYPTMKGSVAPEVRGEREDMYMIDDAQEPERSHDDTHLWHSTSKGLRCLLCGDYKGRQDIFSFRCYGVGPCTECEDEHRADNVPFEEWDDLCSGCEERRKFVLEHREPEEPTLPDIEERVEGWGDKGE